MKHDETNRAYFYLWKLNSPFAIITSVIIFREIGWFNYTRCSSQTTTTQICMIIQITNIHHGRSISTCQNHKRNFEQLSKQVYTLFARNCFHEISTIFCDDSNILENRTRYCVEKVKLKMNRALYRRPIYTSKQLLFLGHGILNEITTRLFIKVFQTLIPVLI